MPEPVSSRTAGSARDLKESISAPTVWKEKNGSTRAWVEPSLWRHTKQETPMEAASNESESCHTYGWYFENEEERQVLDGTSELYRKEKKK